MILFLSYIYILNSFYIKPKIIYIPHLCLHYTFLICFNTERQSRKLYMITHVDIFCPNAFSLGLSEVSHIKVYKRLLAGSIFYRENEHVKSNHPKLFKGSRRRCSVEQLFRKFSKLLRKRFIIDQLFFRVISFGTLWIF